jgi:hypothetical protein
MIVMWLISIFITILEWNLFQIFYRYNLFFYNNFFNSISFFFFFKSNYSKLLKTCHLFKWNVLFNKTFYNKYYTVKIFYILISYYSLSLSFALFLFESITNDHACTNWTYRGQCKINKAFIHNTFVLLLCTKET